MAQYNDINQLMAAQGGVESSVATIQDVANLVKAIEAGSITGREAVNVTTASGAPLKLESMDSVLRNLTYQLQHLRIWNDIPKGVATSNVEEYAQLLDYDSDFEGGFYVDGELPDGSDTIYTRRSQNVKYMGEVGQVTHVARLVNTVGANDQLMKQEVQSRTTALLQRLNRSIVVADASAEAQAFNGLYAQHAKWDNATYEEGSEFGYLNSDRVIDLRGEPLTKEAVANAAHSAVVQGYAAAPGTIYADYTVIEGYRQANMSNFLRPGDTQANPQGIGSDLVSQVTAYGLVNFKGDRFLADQKFTSVGESRRRGSKAPSVVTGLTAAAAPALAGTTSRFGSDDAGTYRYAVRARNRYGVSELVDAGTVAVAAGDSVTLSFSSAGGDQQATEFEVYRTKKDDASGTLYQVVRASRKDYVQAVNGSAANTLADHNWRIAGTSTAFLTDGTSDTWEFRQLGSLFKHRLALINTIDRFMMTIYGTPIMRNPRRFIKIINIGPGTAKPVTSF